MVWPGGPCIIIKMHNSSGQIKQGLLTHALSHMLERESERAREREKEREREREREREHSHGILFEEPNHNREPPKRPNWAL